MKRVILAILFLGAFAHAKAQEPRSMLLYGLLDLSTTRDSTGYKHTLWAANIGLGYQFSTHWTVGGNIMWGQDATKDVNAIKATYNTYRVGPFARYSHYIAGSEIFFWYAHWNFLYTGGYHTSEGNPADFKHTGIYTEVFPALGINMGKAFCLTVDIGGLNYDAHKYAADANNSVGFNFTFGQQVHMGISKNFGGHRLHSSHEPGEEIHRRRMEKIEDEDDAPPTPKRKERTRDDDE